LAKNPVPASSLALVTAPPTDQTQQGVVEAASDHQRGLRTTLSAEGSPAPFLPPPAPVLPPAVVKTSASKTSSSKTVVHQQSSTTVRQQSTVRKCTTGMVNPDGKPHKTAAPPAPVVLVKKGDYNPAESETWKLVIETDPHPISPEQLEEITKPKLDPSMDPHDPIFEGVFEPPKVEPGKRPEKSPFRGASPKLPIGGNSASHSPRNSPAAGETSATGLSTPKAASPLANTLSPPHTAAALSSQPSSGPPSRGRSPRPDDEIPIFETNHIGGRRKIAQSSSFNKLLQDMMQGGQ